MTSNQDSRQDPVDRESALAIVKRVRAFRDRLPYDQARVFNHVLAGAGATFRVAARLDDSSKKHTLLKSITDFRDDLPAAQRDGLDAILLASAFAWGVHAGRVAASVGGDGTPPPPPEDDPVAFVPAVWELVIRVAVGVAVVSAGIIVESGVLEPDEEPLIPDLSDVLN